MYTSFSHVERNSVHCWKTSWISSASASLSKLPKLLTMGPTCMSKSENALKLLIGRGQKQYSSSLACQLYFIIDPSTLWKCKQSKKCKRKEASVWKLSYQVQLTRSLSLWLLWAKRRYKPGYLPPSARARSWCSESPSKALSMLELTSASSKRVWKLSTSNRAVTVWVLISSSGFFAAFDRLAATLSSSMALRVCTALCACSWGTTSWSWSYKLCAGWGIHEYSVTCFWNHKCDSTLEYALNENPRQLLATRIFWLQSNGEFIDGSDTLLLHHITHEPRRHRFES